MANQETQELDISYKAENVLVDKQLLDYVEYKLKKTDISREDLAQVEDIIINGRNIVGDINITNLKDVALFPNLKKLTLKNVIIDVENAKWIQDVKTILFESCEIEDVSQLKNVETLSFTRCVVGNIESINDFTNLKDFRITNTTSDNFSYLENKENLERLVIKNVENFTMDKIDFELPISYLSLEGIDEINYDVLSKYKNLTTISLDYIGQDKTLTQVDKLKELGYEVKYNDMY